MTREEEIEKALNFYAPSFWDDTKTVMTDEELSKLVPWNENVQEICSGTT